MATQPYPMGTTPVQFVGGGIARSKFTPNPGGPGGGFIAGGVVLGGGVLQNTKIFDTTFGSLGWPYLGIRNAYNSNKPVQMVEPGSGFGITKVLNSGTFGGMVKGSYVMLTFNTQLAGVATTVLQSPGSSFRKSENKNIGWVDTVQINRNGGWYYNNGLPVNAVNSRDNIRTEPMSTYSTPGRLVFNSTGKLANVQGYAAKTD